MKSNEMICPDCLNVFIRKAPNQIRCVLCANKQFSIRQSKIKHKEYEKQCHHCKEFYKTNFKISKFCGDACREIHANLKANDKWIKSCECLNKFKACIG